MNNEMPSQLTTIQEAEQFLLAYSPEKLAGETYTLGRMKELMSRLGDLQNKIPAIHVAGTSGKTSTSYYIRSLLQAHGRRTGLSISPHITAITERVQIDGEPLADRLFISYLNEFIAIIENWQDIKLTYFELLTAFGFWVFYKEQVDYMVIEVGLGGLLDATNVITSSNKVSVITPIGLDHTHILGVTIEEIAKQKAGIILPSSDVFVTPQAKAAERVISSVIQRTDSRVTRLEQLQQYRGDIPPFQQDNFKLAQAVVRYIAKRDGLMNADEAVVAACIYNTPPGRFEVYKAGKVTIILDGAHNPQKLAAFCNALRLQYDSPYTWLVGFIEAPDEKIENCLEQIYMPANEYYFTNFRVRQDIKSRKSVDMYELVDRTDDWDAFVSAVSNPVQVLEKIVHSQKQRTVVITGSLYLVAKLRESIRQLAEA